MYDASEYSLSSSPPPVNTRNVVREQAAIAEEPVNRIPNYPTHPSWQYGSPGRDNLITPKRRECQGWAPLLGYGSWR
jgi:hypothetical protein